MVNEDIKKRVLNSIRSEQIIGMLSNLVKIQSPFFHEEEIVQFVKKECEKMGLETKLHQVKEKKITGFEGDEVVARYRGKEGKPVLLLNGHLDTVGLCQGWTKPPWGYLEGNKFYGVGALDMKSGDAAILVALHALKENDVELKGDVLFTGVAAEEGPYILGMYQLVKDKELQDCDFAVVTEPSSGFSHRKQFPCLLLGAKGSYEYSITVKGKSAHGATPEKGINAVDDAARIICALKKIKLPHHPKLGDGKICTVAIKAGTESLSVPDTCTIKIYRLIIPGETKEIVIKQVKDLVESLNLLSKVEVKLRDEPDPQWSLDPYVVNEEERIVKIVKEACKKVTGKTPDIDYMDSVGDCNLITPKLGIPSIQIGASGENPHSADEYVEINTVIDTAKIIALTILETVG